MPTRMNTGPGILGVSTAVEAWQGGRFLARCLWRYIADREEREDSFSPTDATAHRDSFPTTGGLLLETGLAAPYSMRGWLRQGTFPIDRGLDESGSDRPDITSLLVQR